MQSDADTIVAIATAPGRGGIGVVRISGRDLQPIVQAVLGPAQTRLQPRRALHASFLNDAGRPIDDGVALLFPAPNSFTGETVLELQGHGGPVVLRLVLARCLEAGASLGARIAEPGEFTRRAFLNGRLDLAQAEAVADLIDASTVAAARGAMRSLQGDFSRAAHALAQELTELRALTEATLDFPEEEIDFLRAADARQRLERAIDALDETRKRARQGAMLREGLRVVLVGAPNVGKSSLLNALAGEEAAIVTEHPGTTRDRIERTVEIGGIAVHVVDTAGLRATRDPVEGIGIERSLAAARGADLVIELRDASSDDATPLPYALAEGVARLVVINKVDLRPELAPGRHDDAPGEISRSIHVSARTGAGLDALRHALLQHAGWDAAHAGETVYLARERHLHALDRAAAHLTSARLHGDMGAEQLARLELFAEDLRLAADALGEITGIITSDDLLGQIFGRFCIGK